MQKPPIILWLIVVAVACLSLGFSIAFFGYSQTGAQPQPSVAQSPSSQQQNPKGTYEEGYQAGLVFAKKKLAEQNPLTDRPVNEIQGATVKSITGQNITVEFKASMLDFFKDGLAAKTISVSDKTLFERHIPKDSGAYSEELRQYSKTFDNYQKTVGKTLQAPSADEPTPPLPYTFEKISLADLKPGETVSVRTSDDLRTADSVVADAVFLEMSSVNSTATASQAEAQKPSTDEAPAQIVQPENPASTEGSPVQP